MPVIDLLSPLFLRLAPLFSIRVTLKGQLALSAMPVNNYNDCRTCRESKQKGRVEEIVENKDVDDLSRMFGRRM